MDIKRRTERCDNRSHRAYLSANEISLMSRPIHQLHELKPSGERRSLERDIQEGIAWTDTRAEGGQIE